MRYALATWEVRDLLLIPSFMFSESAVIKRLVALKPEVKAESRSRHRQHLDLTFQPFTQAFLFHFQIIMRLQVQPELPGHLEIAAQP